MEIDAHDAIRYNAQHIKIKLRINHRGGEAPREPVVLKKLECVCISDPPGGYPPRPFPFTDPTCVDHPDVGGPPAFILTTWNDP